MHKRKNPYDLSRLGMGFNQPCPKCGKEIDKRTSPYEPIGMIKYCKCRRNERLPRHKKSK